MVIQDNQMKSQLSKKLILTTLALLSSFSLQAESNVVGVPTGWMMESGGGAMDFYNTGSKSSGSVDTCNGRLRASIMPLDEKDRLWSTILAAKISKQSIRVFYDENSDDCNVIRFRVNAS
jgi:hypothetical protein